MLKESLIVCPKRTNDGQDLSGLADLVAAKLAKEFGGYTRSQAVGGWIDPVTGQLYQDPVWQFVSAYDASNPANDDVLRGVAAMIAQIGEQLSVYMRLASGAVEFFDARESIATSAAA